MLKKKRVSHKIKNLKKVLTKSKIVDKIETTKNEQYFEKRKFVKI